MKHDYCCRCGYSAQEARRLSAECIAFGNVRYAHHIWTWSDPPEEEDERG